MVLKRPATILLRAISASALSLSLLAPAGTVMSTPVAAANLPAGATLSVMAQPVEVASAGLTLFQPAAAGQTLQTGDTVRTGTGGLALLTFFDGSETQLGAETQVQVQQADYNPPRIGMSQTSGVTVNRVIPLPPGGSFETNTPSAIGLVRGTSYVVTVSPSAASTVQDASASQDASAVVPSPEDASAPADASDSDSDQVAAAIGDATPVAASVSSIVLLTDRDGHVGHVQVVGSDAQAGAPPLADLTHAGELAATTGTTTATAHLSDSALAQLEQAARDLHDQSSAVRAASEAQHVADALRGVVAPSDGVSKSSASDDSVVVDTTTRLDDASGQVGSTGPASANASATGQAESAAHSQAASAPGAAVSAAAHAASDDSTAQDNSPAAHASAPVQNKPNGTATGTSGPAATTAAASASGSGTSTGSTSGSGAASAAKVPSTSSSVAPAAPSPSGTATNISSNSSSDGPSSGPKPSTAASTGSSSTSSAAPAPAPPAPAPPAPAPPAPAPSGSSSGGGSSSGSSGDSKTKAATTAAPAASGPDSAAKSKPSV